MSGEKRTRNRNFAACRWLKFFVYGSINPSPDRLIAMPFPYSTFLLLHLGATLASAVVIQGPNGSSTGNITQASLNAFTTAVSAPAFPYWNNVIQVSDSSGTYLGSSGAYGWVMTAAHVTPLGVGSSTITVNGTPYLVRDSQPVGLNDLRLYRIGGETGDPALPGLPNVLMSTASPAAGTSLLDFGRGSRLEGTVNSATNSDITLAPGTDPNYYEWGSASNMRWGTNATIMLPPWLGSPTPNLTATVGSFTTNLIYSSFDDVGSGNYLTATEAHFAVGDSGGPAFGLNAGTWQLTGWNLYTLTDPGNPSQPSNTSGFGNLAFYGNISSVKGAIDALAVPEPAHNLLIVLTASVLLRRKRVSV
jgi:hypothetical protein